MQLRKVILAWLCFQGTVSGIAAQRPADARVGPRLAEVPIARIGIVADAQYCDYDASLGRYYRIALEKLHHAVDTFNAEGVSMVFNLGDLIDRSLTSYPAVLREMDRLQMPVHHLLGNHEFWGVPYHQQQGIYDSLGLSSGYCDLSIPGWRLLLLDGTELAEYSQGAHPEVQEEGARCRASLAGHENGAVWNGAIGTDQMAWIEWHLLDAATRGEKVALFCHFPISPAGHPMSLWNEADLRVMLARHPNAQAWFAGHDHVGGYHFLQDLHHLTFEGMVMTPDSNTFAILDFFEDRIVVEGFGREPFRTLPAGNGRTTATTIFPDTLPPPDAMPDPEIPCIHRRVVDALGRAVQIEDSPSNQGLSTATWRPGCFGIVEEQEGVWRCYHQAVLPKLAK